MSRAWGGTPHTHMVVTCCTSWKRPGPKPRCRLRCMASCVPQLARATPAGVYFQLQEAPCACEVHMEDSVKDSVQCNVTCLA